MKAEARHWSASSLTSVDDDHEAEVIAERSQSQLSSSSVVEEIMEQEGGAKGGREGPMLAPARIKTRDARRSVATSLGSPTISEISSLEDEVSGGSFLSSGTFTSLITASVVVG